MLPLIISDRHQVDIVADDVRCHEDRVIEHSHIEVMILRLAVFEAVSPEHQGIRSHGIEDPVELGDERDVGLLEDLDLRIESKDREVRERQLPCVLLQRLSIEHTRERMHIRDE